MAGKRTATSDLNHENWDREDEIEDAGTFQRASEDSLKKRIIKTARRRNPISSVRENEDSSEKKSAFAGFTGFTKGSPVLPTNNSFSFLNNMASKTEQTKVNGFSEKSQMSVNKTDSISSGKSNVLTNISTQDKKKKGDDYYSKLKGLNESVSKWIKHHVDANPFISLQPIFRDYERYLKELENGKEAEENKSIETKNKEEAVSSMSNFLFKPVETVPDSTTGKLQEEKNKSASSSNNTQFSFGSTPLTSTQPTSKPAFAFGSSPATSTFSFGASTNSTTTTTSSGTFSFGSSVSTATVPSFSFSASTPVSFGATPISKPTSTEEEKKEEDAEDEPPKVEFTPVVEKDYLYTTRCKMFVKKDKEFSDRGVGNLYLKSIETSEKVQVILRADTNLGNLLCNFILSETIPITRVGKKDVMLVCLPSPDSKPPPVPVLLRVKSPEDADKLFETFNKYKK